MRRHWRSLRSGRTAILTEATDWIGGQLTSQAVPPDEHPWIERFGASASYRKLRHEIRAHYRRHYPLTAEARANERLNPGNGSVSALCHEPRAALAALTALLAPFASSRKLLIAARARADRRGHAGRPGAVCHGSRSSRHCSSELCTLLISSTPPSWAIFCRWRASNS